MEVHFLVLSFTVGIATIYLMCAKISINFIIMHALWKAYTDFSSEYTKRTFYPIFTPLSAFLLGELICKWLKALHNKDLRFILGDWLIPLKAVFSLKSTYLSHVVEFPYIIILAYCSLIFLPLWKISLLSLRPSSYNLRDSKLQFRTTGYFSVNRLNMLPDSINTSALRTEFQNRY